MKKIIALILALALAFGCVGCTKLEAEHFDKSMNVDMTGLHEIEQNINITINPEILCGAIIEISDNMDGLLTEETETEAETETETEGVAEAENSEEIEEYIPESEPFFDFGDEDNGADEFISEFIKEIRFALNEDKLFVFDINVNGAVDYDNMYSDENVSCKFNNITIDCGNAYVRGNAIYMDKKLMYTLGALNYLSDIELLSAYYTKLDEAFGDKEFVCMDYSGLNSQFSGTNMILQNSNVLQTAQLDIYEQAKEVLSDFDSGCVTKIENGTRFELTSKDFVGKAENFADYIIKHSDDSAGLVNSYFGFMFATSKGIYGDTSEDISGMQSIYDEMQVNGDDIVEAMEGFKESINSDELNIVLDTLNIAYTNDITSVNDVNSNNVAISVKYNNEDAVSLYSNSALTDVKEYSFTEIDEAQGVAFEDMVEAFENFTYDYYNDLYGGYDSVDTYECPDCGEVFEYTETKYCEKCGFIHDFYEYDENCHKQPGCEIAKEETQVAA